MALLCVASKICEELMSQSLKSIPEFILDFKTVEVPATNNQSQARWVNAFSDEFLGRDIKNLYATETLFGNWNGELLLLAQDALPAPALRSTIDFHLARGDQAKSAWRHADRLQFRDKAGWRTNQILRDMMKSYAPNIGAVYGSAASHMLYDDGQSKYSQNLRGYYSPELQLHLINVLNFAVNSMPNLKYIMCLGHKAWDLVTSAANANLKESFQLLRDSSQSVELNIQNKSVLTIPAYHPAARVSKEKIARNWDVLKASRGL